MSFITIRHEGRLYKSTVSLISQQKTIYATSAIGFTKSACYDINTAMSKVVKKPDTVKFGEHMIFDAYNCKFERLMDMQLCYDVLENLVKLAAMRKITEPYLIKAEGNETLGGKDPGGFSGFVIIQESHVSIHTFARRGFVTIDLYSCKSFKSEGIVEYLKKTFETDDVSVIKMERGLKYPIENIY